MTARQQHSARATVLTTLVLSILTSTSAKVSQHGKRAVNPVYPVNGAKYDYIIVGAGTAGATLAARLSEDPSVTIAVLEAGNNQQDLNPYAFIPGACVVGVGADPKDTQPVNDWGPITQPQMGAANRSLHYARGKGVGGSSIKNFMVGIVKLIYQRPDRTAFESWQRATADEASPGWGWNDVYPYFTKSVTITPANDAIRGAQFKPRYNPQAFPETNPSKAPLPLTWANFAFNYSATLTDAYNELGYSPASDFSSGTLNGYAYNPSTINPANGHRATSQMFIKNAQLGSAGRNLVVATQVLAKRINFDANMNAVSVTFTNFYGTFEKTIFANREIIIAAGAFQSPQLLMVSGIGPKEHLAQFGIKPLVDLPGVGQNLQDHAFFSPGYEIKNNIYNLGAQTQPANLGRAEGQVLNHNLGSLTNPVSDHIAWGRMGSGFFKEHPAAAAINDPKKHGKLSPHYELISSAGLTGDFSNLNKMNSVLAAQKPPRLFYALLGALVAPLSRGTVTLASADTKVYPKIDPNWITHPGDKAVAIEIYRKIRRIFNTRAFRAVRANDEEYYPGLNVTTNAQILQTIQASVQTVWHAACTCAMGARSKGGVLDPYLRVHGVNRLRVVDASAFPMLPPGHPQSVVYMLAERAADFIKETRTGVRIPPHQVTLPTGDFGAPYTGN
ncbi:BZ3500_MvSof-1268-A1-R1_Chr5-2g08036 [Microbotryum saponariae]|uniref:BZ3500_MvSof-1268-A1-R1_Chr5-2g08036 protein n=1 Tax=Microbotryum saponariae TaxID=289078 RepID=A0A2X0KLE8_9BASI|nr:BZ3500_MvSof-1268-A1-R1_Chr5-2g08036 [Microbotryum saponariae]SDA05905.1 BZ3501_MvSof-1269-A2-R1_Chr5-2g07858 [Microbotryum saponariae]